MIKLRNDKPKEKKKIDELNDILISLEQFCHTNRLPMYVSVAVNSIDEDKYVTRSLTPKDLGLNIADDRITPLSLSNNKYLKLVFADKKEEEINVGDIYGDILD